MCGIICVCVCCKTNLSKVTRNLKEGLDISKLSTTGADFELIPNNEDAYIEDEKEAEQYQQKLIENLNPACADFCDEEDGKNSNDDSTNDDNDDNIKASIIICLL